MWCFASMKAHLSVKLLSWSLLLHHCRCGLVGRSASTSLQLLSWLSCSTQPQHELCPHTQWNNSLRSDDVLFYFRGASAITGVIMLKSRAYCCFVGACVFVCVFVGDFAPQLFCCEQSETQTRGFLSECSCCLPVYWVRIYYSAIFLCYVLQSRGRWREERQRQREGGLATAQDCVPIG